MGEWLDTNGDGYGDAYADDTDGDGVVEQVVVDWNADGVAEEIWVPGADGRWVPVEQAPVDTVTYSGPTPYETLCRGLLSGSHDVLVHYGLGYEEVYR